MNPEDQKKRSRKQHINGMQAGNTCIDCHKGIAHTRVHDQLSEEELTAMEQPHPDNKRPIPPQWQAFIDGKNGATETPREAAAGTTATATQTEPAQDAEHDRTRHRRGRSRAQTDALQQPQRCCRRSNVDWSAIEAREVALFYPGQASMEWILKGSDHGGKRAFDKAIVASNAMKMKKSISAI